MLKLKNIKIIGTDLFVDCYPEGSENEHFSLVINIISKKITKNSLNRRNMYVMQALYKIIQLLNTGNELPKEASSVWY